jgi:hypothetical protein
VRSNASAEGVTTWKATRNNGNPKGRPHTKGLLAALRSKVAEVDANGRTVEALLQEALRGKHRLPAVEMIFDRLEGRARQTIEVADITKELREKSDEELRFYLEHSRSRSGQAESHDQ